MAAVVSHAMRRFPTTQPDAVYSYGLRPEGSRKPWSPSEEGESALSRSMRYADPWLYGSVRAPGGLVLAPAFVLCTCSDYVNGTKRSSKKTPTSCKKCKGTRLPLSESKFGTVRCYPTSSTPTPTRAGTMRVVGSSRPSILPDPYDLMRRSRLSSRSVSPRGRRSILECDINPYELMEAPRDASITLVNGQRIRVRPPTAEEVQVKRPAPKVPPKKAPNEKESECNRFKSILKKPTTFSDTDSNSREHSPSPASRSGSHFYLPMPGNTPRKKVQFLVENELDLDQNRKDEEEMSNEEGQDNSDQKVCKLRRSVSERFNHGSKKVVFHDTMALRSRPSRSELRLDLGEEDLERLDGLTSKTRRKSPTKVRPNEPPPPPPPSKPTQKLGKTQKIKDEKSEKKIEETCASQPAKTQKFKELVEEKSEKKIEETCASQPAKTQKIKDEKSEKKIEETRQEVAPPPSVPPRKRSNNKQPHVNIIQTSPSVHSVHVEPPPNVQIEPLSHFVQIESPPSEPANKTVVQINGSPTVHKLQIKNEFADVVNIQTVSVLDNPQRKTSIMITGDDCYSTVNVNDDVPLYQSSVVVKDTPNEKTVHNTKKSSSVYIIGNFVTPLVENNELKVNESENMPEKKEYEECDLIETPQIHKKENLLLDTFNENNIPSSEMLKELLKDPVEAVRRNLVPHVCGKSDVSRRPRPKKFVFEELNSINIEESLLRMKNLDLNDDVNSEHSSSTQYELMDASSECYTDHSNRSSVTEEELANRTKFYELLADSALIEVSESEDHHYESIKNNSDPIYEEIEIPPPLPANPPPLSLLDDLHLDKEYTTRSIFEGASKYDILSYLVDAKERGIVQEDNYSYNDDTKETYNRICHISTVSDSSEDNSLIMPSNLIDDKVPFQKTAEVERNDSGVGSETSKSSLSKYRMKQETTTTCEDCEAVLESSQDTEPLICRKCLKKRSERKEIITEIVETEEKYSRDLQIILEEFYQPMLVAGLLTPEQLSAIFLNVEELLENSQSLAERLRDAVEIAVEQGDEDLLTVNIGKIFLEAAPMLHGFETYCVRQGAASLLLASLEKEKELLRIFLRVSQMENTMLRRMNLNSFLMVPVQRVTKYPLLLARLYKVTPVHHETREQLKEAQHKIELHLNHMNSETKDVPSKLWRRIGSSSGRRSSTEMDLVNIKLRKIAVDVLEWNHDEAKFALEGKLLFTQPTDNNWRKGRTIKLTPVNALLVINGKPSMNRPERTDENGLIFSRHSAAREAALLLVRDKNGRYSLLREPLYLDRCVIAADPAWQSYFEVQELLGKDTFIFKAEDEEQTKIWYSQLQFHAQGMGAWRKRRNALANIMINGMGLRS
ncbi:uncharacterized protein LOC123004106 [Tribolium madens]|uniref:uncharacterized protein LOC123004106 n=1 Tax=Tribolium madens TaxID=41895 RepID=UPI001CF74C8E|nr:uncharacterized protein LOC123004106 [Tribolium madens]